MTEQVKHPMGDISAELEAAQGSTTKRDSKLVKDFEDCLKEGKNAFAKWRSRARRYYKAYSGESFSDEDKAYMRQTGRPFVRYNLALGTINAVVGADMTEQKEVRFEGLDTNTFDKTVGEWFTKLVRHQAQRTNSRQHESNMFLDKLLTGYGWNRVYLDNRRFPFRMRQGQVDPWKMIPDPDAKDDNLTDAKWLIHEDTWTRSEVEATWPQHKSKLRGFFSAASTGDTATVRRAHATDYKDREGGAVTSFDRRDMLRIYEFQHIKPEAWTVFKDPRTGEQKNVRHSEFEDLRDAILEETDPVSGEYIYDEIESVTYPRDVTYRAFFASETKEGGKALLLENLRLEADRFTYVCDTGFPDKNPETGRTQRFGLMHVVFDPQRYAMRVLSLIIEMLSRGAKGGAWAETSAFQNPETAMEDYAKPGGLVLLNDGALSSPEGRKVQDRHPMQWPSSMDRLLAIMTDALPETSGVTSSLKGTLTEERANVLVSNLQTQNMTMLNPVYSPLTEARKTLGYLIAKFAILYMTDDQINKIIGEVEVPGVTHEIDEYGRPVQDPETGRERPIMKETGEPITPADILRNVDLLEFNVEVDIGVASPTVKQSVWRILVDTNLLGQLAELGMPMDEFLVEMLKYLPLPADAAKRLAAKMEASVRQRGVEGMLATLQQLPDDEMMQVMQALQQMLEERQQGEQSPVIGQEAGHA